jgi:hypothetical protein
MIKIQRDEQTGFDDLHYRMYENEVKMQKLKNMGRQWQWSYIFRLYGHTPPTKLGEKKNIPEMKNRPAIKLSDSINLVWFCQIRTKSN